MTVALATRGMIGSCCKIGQIVSSDSPDVQAVLEVRPRIRMAAAPATDIPPAPIMVGSKELKPSTDAETPPPSSASPTPTQTSAQELKPIIKKVEED